MSSIIHTTDKPVITVTAFHNDLFAILNTGLKAKQLMDKKVLALVKTKYAAMPAYVAYANDCDAIAKLITDKGLSDNSNHYHKAYRAAIVELFGALPVSMDGDARRKQVARMDDAQKATYEKTLSEQQAAGKPVEVATALAAHAVKSARKQVVQPAAGAPKGQVQTHPSSHKETLEQVVTRYGMFELMDAIASILLANKETADKAKALTSLRNNLAKVVKPAEVRKAA